MQSFCSNTENSLGIVHNIIVIESSVATLEREKTALFMRTALAEKKLLLHKVEALVKRKKGFGMLKEIFGRRRERLA